MLGSYNNDKDILDCRFKINAKYTHSEFGLADKTLSMVENMHIMYISFTTFPFCEKAVRMFPTLW